MAPAREALKHLAPLRLRVKIIEWSKAPIEHPLVLVGFPSQGLVGGIAADYLIETTEMWLHATVHDDALPPVMTVRKGIALSPIQIYAGSMRCGLDGDCDQLVIVRSDVVPEPTLWSRLADGIVEWAQSKDARLVVCLEGVRMDARDGAFAAPQARSGPRVFGVATPSAGKQLEAAGATPLQESTVSGFSSAVLVRAIERGVDALAMFVETAVDHPDSEASAQFLSRLDKLVPHIPIDPEPLRERAKKLETKIRGDLDGQRNAIERIQENVMYV